MFWICQLVLQLIEVILDHFEPQKKNDNDNSNNNNNDNDNNNNSVEAP